MKLGRRKRCGVLGAVAGLAMLLAGGASASAAIVTFPTPGSRVVSPQAQIAFRGLSYSQLKRARISVAGSRSGTHAGTLAADSDGRGGSFLPGKPFAAGETVTVRTSLRVTGARRGTFQFTVVTPAGAIPFRPVAKLKRAAGDVWQFHSAPGLAPTAVTFYPATAPTAAGDIFLAPQIGPLQYGPEIIDPQGNLVWSQPAPPNDEVTDFRTQTYQGQPVLTWWQGNTNAASGRGVDVIYNSSYQQIATVQAANGLSADLHEFEITRANTALITAYYPVYWNASSIHGPSRQITLDGVVQEIDIKTGLLLYQWDSLDHVPLSASYAALPGRSTRNPFDYFHVNSIDVDRDGTLIVSARNTWAAYKLSHQTGAVYWTLGGKQSSFKMGRGTQFAFQHDVRVRSNHDWFVTIFDDGGGPPQLHPSRGLKLFLDVKHHTARKVSQASNTPALPAYVEGNDQQLPNGDSLIGWGSEPYFSEFSPSGRQIFTGRFVDNNASYRVYRLPWSGTPQQPPAIAASANGAQTIVYASWNGATAVASWRVLEGSSPSSLQPVANAVKTGFETQIPVAAQPYVAVQALDLSGQVLGQSSTVSPS